MLSLALTAVGLSPASIRAQEDGLNLPTELYTLVNDGHVERYGLGASGVSAVTPENEVVIDFGVAPDGIWLAYRTESGLTVRNMLTDESRQIEGASAGIPPFRGRGATLAWSPDGTVLAYTVDYGLRFYFDDSPFFDIPITPILNLVWSPDSRFLAAEAENNIWWIYRRDGGQLILTSAIPSSIGLTWVGAGLLMFTPEDGGLFLMDVSSGNAQSQLADQTTLYRLPVFRRDGKVSVFARPANDTTFSATQGFLYQVTPSGDNISIEQVSDLAVDFGALRWSPGGNLLLTLSGGVIALVDGGSGQGFALPITGVVAYGWGALRPASVPTLPLTATGYFIADDGTGIEQLWQTSQDAALSVQVLAAESNVSDYAIAPGRAADPTGSTIAYHSGGQLLLLPAAQDTAVPLLELDDMQHLTFNADGTALAYDSAGSIYTLALNGDEPEALLTQYTQPQYAPDGSALLVRIGDGDLGLRITSNGEMRRLGSFEWGKWLNASRIAVYGSLVVGTQPGVYVIDWQGGNSLLVFAPEPGKQVLDAALAQDGSLRIVVAKQVQGPAALEVIAVPLTGSTIAGDPVSMGSAGFITTPRFSPDGRFIAGIASAAGNIVLYDLETRQERVLLQPPRARAFTWH